MKIKTLLLRSALAFSALATFGASSAHAAVMEMVSDRGTAAIGQTIEVDVKINSEGTGVNAAEATIQFPPAILEVTSISKEDSVFNFWLDEPTFSNETGRISFTGGSTSGFSGGALQIIKIIFKTKAAGEGEVAFLDGAVTASDGSGTNVLNAMRGTKITVTTQVLPPGVSPTPTPAEIVPPPVQIEREPVPTGNLPVAPEVKVSLYPDPAAWHNLSSIFSASWPLPADVTAVSTLLNTVPTSNPVVSQGLFENKAFPALDDGIRYLHVRFRNNVGWGPTTHYRIAIDTVPPLAFEVSVDRDGPSENPAPVLSYRSGDGLSGLKHYAIRVAGGTPELTTQESYALKPLPPGKYTLIVAAVDNAGNSTEQSVEVEILPIDPPVITFVSERIILDENNVTIAGTALANASVKIVLKSEEGYVVAEKTVETDNLGNWSGEFNEPLRRGRYFVEVTTEDERGALSLPVTSAAIIATDRPIFTIAGFGITPTMFIVMLIVAIIGIVGGALMYYRSQTLKVARRVIIAQRDVAAMANVISANVDKLSNMAKQGDVDKEQLKVIVEKTKEDSARMKKYVVENIGEIKD